MLLFYVNFCIPFPITHFTPNSIERKSPQPEYRKLRLQEISRKMFGAKCKPTFTASMRPHWGRTYYKSITKQGISKINNNFAEK